MLVRDLMTPTVHFCTVDQHASDAARAMADFDIGAVPVVDEEHFPIAMVTDRDIALACYQQSEAPHTIPLRSVMSRGIHSCKVSDTVTVAERIMRDWQVRRLPVVDEHGRLVGLLSLNDIVLAFEHSALARAQQRVVGDLAETLAAICRRRTTHVARPC
jgi:CBS domain-containing protein